MSGYILESKSIIDSDIWKKPPLYFKVWHYLLLKAQFADKGGLKRGQLFTTINEIAESCSYYVGYRKEIPTRKEVWSVLEFLRNPHEEDNETDSKGTMIETTKVTHGIIVTICNYNKYQNPKTYERNSECNDEIRTKEQRNGQRGNNINNELNESNEEKIPTVSKGKSDTPIRKQIPPTVEMVRAYCLERGNNVDAEKFCDFYESKNWYVGKNKMKDWQAAVRTWEKQDGKSDAITKTQRDLSNVYSGISQEEGQKLDRLFGKE